MKSVKMSDFRAIRDADLDAFLSEPVFICYWDIKRAVLMSIPDYERLANLEPKGDDKREFIRVNGKLFVKV